LELTTLDPQIRSLVSRRIDAQFASRK
jgi:hypothetical protein